MYIFTRLKEKTGLFLTLLGVFLIALFTFHSSLPEPVPVLKMEAIALGVVERSHKHSTSVYGIYQLDSGQRLERSLSPVGQFEFKVHQRVILSVPRDEISPEGRPSSARVFFGMILSGVIMGLCFVGFILELFSD